tara:strand:- start:321 stop:926 length:606 start_codon:yes stop_codon:yes gene_type:complete
MNLRTKKNKYKRRREDILSLRRQGLTYQQIQKELGCSKGTISYHCGKNQSEKKRVKSIISRPLCKKVTRFKSRCSKESWRGFSNKVKCFKRRNKGNKRTATTHWRVNVKNQYTCADVVEKIGVKPVCYLTGRKINLSKPSEYSLDHRVPSSRGGTNELENLEICSHQANQAKADLTLDEFYKLCEDVLLWRKKLLKRKKLS